MVIQALCGSKFSKYLKPDLRAVYICQILARRWISIQPPLQQFLGEQIWRMPFIEAYKGEGSSEVASKRVKLKPLNCKYIQKIYGNRGHIICLYITCGLISSDFIRRSFISFEMSLVCFSFMEILKFAAKVVLTGAPVIVCFHDVVGKLSVVTGSSMQVKEISESYAWKPNRILWHDDGAASKRLRASHLVSIITYLNFCSRRWTLGILFSWTVGQPDVTSSNTETSYHTCKWPSLMSSLNSRSSAGVRLTRRHT